MFASKLAVIAASALIALGAASATDKPEPTNRGPRTHQDHRADPAAPFKCLVSPHVDSLLVRWSRGDIATAVQAFAPDGPGGFAGFSFGRVRAAHRSELAAQMATWHPESAMRALDFRILGFESEDVMNVGSIRIGTRTRPRAYDANAVFNCRTLKFVSFRATVPTEP